MDLSTLTSTPGARRKRKRVGRGPGSGKGKTSGRGHKGQKSRSGYSHVPGYEGGQMPLYRRLPKRGFRHRDRFPCAIVNVDTLQAAFEDGATVTLEALVAKGLADVRKGGVKILGRGKISKKLSVVANAISQGARAKIEAAGGAVDIVSAAAEARPEAPPAPPVPEGLQGPYAGRPAALEEAAPEDAEQAAAAEAPTVAPEDAPEEPAAETAEATARPADVVEAPAEDEDEDEDEVK